jgi:hypothetical protein
MYIYIMVRTQIYLTEPIAEALERLSAETGRSMSQLIRDALMAAYVSAPSKEDMLQVLRSSAGSWGDGESGEDTVERLRAGRLAALQPPEPS